jgi:hypothetical protein
MKFETIKLLKLSYLLMICHHVGVVTVRFPHDLIDDELSVAADVKPLDPDLGGDVHAIDEGLILCHIVCCTEMPSKHVEELISLGGDQHKASPRSVESEEVVEVHAPVLPGNQGRQWLGFSPFCHKVCQGLGLDHHLRDVCYVELHELESPLGNPSHGEAVSDNFPELV